MCETTPQHRRTSSAQEVLTHADSTVRTTCVGIASTAPAVRRAPQCMLRVTPRKATKVSGYSFTALSLGGKRGLGYTGSSAALHGQAAQRESQGLPARAGSSREGRSWAGRAGVGGCRERCLAGGAGGASPVRVGALQGQVVHQQVKQQSWFPLEVPLLQELCLHRNPKSMRFVPFRHNLVETGQQTELLERGMHRHRRAQASFPLETGL